MPSITRIQLSPEIELERIVPLEQAAEVEPLSPDTLKRRYPDRLVKLSPRRLGMRLKHALLLSEP